MKHVHDARIMMLVSMMLVPIESVGSPGRDRGGEGLGQGYYEVWMLGSCRRLVLCATGLHQPDNEGFLFATYLYLSPGPTSLNNCIC